MKRFVVKFYAFFAIIFGVIGYYAWQVQPELSGDMGRIGQIPFGKKYETSIKTPYDSASLRVQTIHQSDSITDSVITIGDSFSQFGIYGYSQFVANALDCHITNIAVEDECPPEQLFVQLVNRGRIPPQSVVILESVERYMVDRLNSLDFSDSTLNEKKDVSLDTPVQKSNLLDGVIIWLRTSLGLRQTIHTFKTDRDLFTHPARHNELYIYDSKWNHDGDLRFKTELLAPDIEQAWLNLYRLHDYAEECGVTLLYLIAADKYDVYEPFIEGKHEKNHTLDYLPEEHWIINSKVILQEKVYKGTQDIYYINDTHWSPIGAQIVGDELAKRIQIVQ